MTPSTHARSNVRQVVPFPWVQDITASIPDGDDIICESATDVPEGTVRS